MFTGIIEGTGTVESISRSTSGGSAIRMTVDLGKNARGLKIGQSVALNGVCLTVIELNKGRCSFEMIQETAEKTSMGDLKKGSTVNIERSLKASDRLEGHFVLGHVDGVGTIAEIQEKPDEVQVWFQLPEELTRYVVKKGSIAVDGISLTVVDTRKNMASVCMIPHTIQVTNFTRKAKGDKVNIETDILGKYILGKNNLQI